MKKSAVGSSLLSGNKRKVLTEETAVAAALKKAGPKGSSQAHAQIVKATVEKLRLDSEVGKIVERNIKEARNIVEAPIQSSNASLSTEEHGI